jgi:hypothetical protein
MKRNIPWFVNECSVDPAKWVCGSAYGLHFHLPYLLPYFYNTGISFYVLMQKERENLFSGLMLFENIKILWILG